MMNKEELLKYIIKMLIATGFGQESTEEDLNVVASAIFQRDAIIVELLEELDPHRRSDHTALTRRALYVIGLSEEDIDLYLEGKIVL